ncbi:hypothetical protein RDWZM_001873 [Blomia tropicalis]|uniref:ER-bound oxygenase mpaB/mpaB'/Rubber oxygenase catalytic domain-containing protein n=1 Tax=Blomia tropicalis TaxID=40697 RepID=A0A9Q0RPD5_BLOTA|nr:hypothetical protein RDWZM_001873 [Blomia tropicalis]
MVRSKTIRQFTFDHERILYEYIPRSSQRIGVTCLHQIHLSNIIVNWQIKGFSFHLLPLYAYDTACQIVVKQMHQSVSDIQNRDVEPNQPVAMSQRDMTLTQFAFIGLIVMYPKEMGFSSRTEDLDRLIYFWRCIGYMLGIDDEYNLCEGNYQTVRTNCEQIFKHKFIPSLLEMKPESDEMSERIIISASHYIVLLRHRGLLRYLFEVANLNIPVVLDQSENLFYITLKWTMSTLIHYRFFAIILNNLLRFALYQLTFKRFVNSVVKSLEQFYDEK